MWIIYYSLLFAGLALAAVGMYCLTYVEHKLNSGKTIRATSDVRSTRRWPLWVAFTTIPMGIAIAAGAIIWKNHWPG